MKITSIEELTIFARFLESVLIDADHDEIARRIADCLQLSSVPGEIYGCLRFVLKEIKNLNADFLEKHAADLNDAIQFLDLVLERMNE